MTPKKQQTGGPQTTKFIHSVELPHIGPSTYNEIKALEEGSQWYRGYNNNGPKEGMRYDPQTKTAHSFVPEPEGFIAPRILAQQRQKLANNAAKAAGVNLSQFGPYRYTESTGPAPPLPLRSFR